MLRSPVLGYVLALLLLLLAPPFAASAQDEDDQRARLHFEAGRSHFEDGAYDRAREEFARAFELSGRPGLLLNLATTHERLAMYDDAIENLRTFIERVPDDPQVPRLQRRIQNLERLRDERAAGSEPTEPTDLGEDDAPDDAPDGARAEPAPPSTPDRPPGSAGGGLRLGGVIGLSVGALGLGATAIFGALALSEDAALRDGCGANASCTADEVRRANDLARVADIGLIIGLVGIAVGTTLLVLGLRKRRADLARATITPFAGLRTGGLSLQGWF
ncbi:MAG: tetratricopeptide repeat protein [Myxococcales bacterium]|nr:tetratricopeptide repeat protein [Myxococcales bacterium]